eukprot:2753773-Heterocapsa_arctica.AAC.1
MEGPSWLLLASSWTYELLPHRCPETGWSLHHGGDSLLNPGPASTRRIVIDAGIRLGCPASGT